jgi:hypothetical protein
LRRHGHPWGIANRRRRLQFRTERIEQQLRRREQFYRAAHIEHTDSVNLGPAEIKHTDPKAVTDPHADPHADAHTDTDPHADAHTDTDPHADAHARTRLTRHRRSRV